MGCTAVRPEVTLFRDGREVSVLDIASVVGRLNDSDSPDAVIWEDFREQVNTACVLTEVFGGTQFFSPADTPDGKTWEVVCDE